MRRTARAFRSTERWILDSGGNVEQTIPFNETRDYVKKVLANTMLYAQALGRPYVPLSTRLGTVLPRGSAALPD